ncbi:MAG: IS1595 family transposase [Spirochaetes bacterium]|nr:IS1595 family transposase [Spirochaetota bacterium]
MATKKRVGFEDLQRRFDTEDACRNHLSLRIWAIYLVSRDKRGYSAMQLSRVLNLPYNTAWFLLHRIRNAMAEWNSRYLLKGIVELDDTYSGKTRKGSKRGRGTTKNKIIVAISKDEDGKPQYVKMQVVADLKGKTIARFVKNSIAEGTTVQTDAYRSYRKPLAEKYLHEYQVFDADSDMLKWLHTIVSNAKAFVAGTFHGLGKKHLQSYLDEYCYRFNRRNMGGMIFDRLLFAMTQSPPFRFADLS